MKNRLLIKGLVVCWLSMFLVSGCKNTDNLKNDASPDELSREINTEATSSNETKSIQIEEITTGIAHESAKDSNIDFSELVRENPDIYAWLHIPRTNIDIPILQSGASDDYYMTHDAYGNISVTGAAYSEMATMRNMCDFNTVLRGSGGENGVFNDLVQFEDSEFFNENENLYVYLDGNLLTYEIIGAYRTEEDTPIREYDFWYSEECQKFVNKIFNEKQMGKNTREGWEGLNEYNFLITLYTDTPDDSGKHLVIVGVLINDAAGTINREVPTEEEFDISILFEG